MISRQKIYVAYNLNNKRAYIYTKWPECSKIIKKNPRMKWVRLSSFFEAMGFIKEQKLRFLG